MKRDYWMWAIVALVMALMLLTICSCGNLLQAGGHVLNAGGEAIVSIGEHLTETGQ